MIDPLVDALLYGNLAGVPEDLQFLFARTGLVHLFSASGFHLWSAALVADFLAKPLLPFARGRKAQNAIRFFSRLALMLFFGNATGWSSPMLRAFVFAALAGGARLLELETSRSWVFLISLVVSAALGKGGTLSFLLSALGMAGILYVQPRKAWMVALGPWLFTLPLTIWFFGIFPLWAPLWNLTFGLAVSWLVIPLAFVSLLLRSILLPVPFLDEAAGFLMRSLVGALRVVADFVGGAFWVNGLSCGLLALALAAAFVLWRSQTRRLGLVLALSAVALAMALPGASLAALDVGQGDAVLLRTSGGLVLSDVGPPGFEGGAAPVARSLEAEARGDLGDVMLSHFDLDHRGGLDSLFARHVVRGALWFREDDLFVAHALEVLAAAERAGVPIRFLREGSAPPGIECWLAPFEKGNDSSPLCRASLWKAAPILLTGDMSEKAEDWFVRNLRPFPSAPILKVAHHGSKTSSSEEFLQASQAKIALISVGIRNRYHHPTPEALARLSKMTIRRTDQEGTLRIYPWKLIFR